MSVLEKKCSFSPAPKMFDLIKNGMLCYQCVEVESLGDTRIKY